jgi:hypothetical protein|tara:strand:+ start:702 stop:821 length:120 start_codon:yes stop_codon:yes gene_type:complete
LVKSFGVDATAANQQQQTGKTFAPYLEGQTVRICKAGTQ